MVEAEWVGVSRRDWADCSMGITRDWEGVKGCQFRLDTRWSVRSYVNNFVGNLLEFWDMGQVFWYVQAPGFCVKQLLDTK